MASNDFHHVRIRAAETPPAGDVLVELDGHRIEPTEVEVKLDHRHPMRLNHVTFTVEASLDIDLPEALVGTLVGERDLLRCDDCGKGLDQ